jgi:1-deoxy-D-xylulose-5-phosphate reductoisomerase
MQKIVLLGATGSIGTQVLEIIRQYPKTFQLVAVSANRNGEKLLNIADEFGSEKIFLASGSPLGRQVAKLEDLINEEIDHLIVADHGLDSYAATLKALALQKQVSMANKELLVVHGEDIVYFAKEQQAELIPLDSEHNALYQALKGERISDVKRLIITASGGPFRDRSWNELANVTVDDVLKHPTWKMGKKTTVDSATLVNKAFEVIETHHLFGIPYEKIEVRLHPQSIIHAIVEFNDGNSKIIASKPDMRIPLSYALFFPERAPRSLAGVTNKDYDFDQNLILEKIESGRFPCFDTVLQFAKDKPEQLAQIVENDAQAVADFLAGKGSFHDILNILQRS